MDAKNRLKGQVAKNRLKGQVTSNRHSSLLPPQRNYHSPTQEYNSFFLVATMLRIDSVVNQKKKLYIYIYIYYMYVYMFRKSPSTLQKSNPNSHLFYCLSCTYNILIRNLSAFCSTLYCSQQNENL